MSYGNDYSNKPFERASKTSHTNIINDAAVQSFLSKCKIPPYFEEIDDKDVELHMLEELDENPIKNIITIDGGYTNVYVKEDFPSSTIAFSGVPKVIPSLISVVTLLLPSTPSFTLSYTRFSNSVELIPEIELVLKIKYNLPGLVLFLLL